MMMAWWLCGAALAPLAILLIAARVHDARKARRPQVRTSTDVSRSGLCRRCRGDVPRAARACPHCAATIQTDHRKIVGRQRIAVQPALRTHYVIDHERRI